MTALEEARTLTVWAMAARLGLTSMDRGSLGPCPVCGAATRSQSRPTRRGPLQVLADGRGWRCWAGGCEARGDAVALLAAVATGTTRPTDWRPVWERYGDADPNGFPAVTRQAPEPKLPSDRRAPPSEVGILVAMTRPVMEDPGVCAWLRSRGLDPGAVQRGGLARALVPMEDARHDVEERAGIRGEEGPASPEARAMAGHPVWGAFGPRWWAEGWRLILPVYDGAGELVGVRARWVGDGPAPRAKEHGGTGIAHGPGVYACRMARGLLGRRLPVGASPYLGSPPWDGRVVIAEGGADWLTWATHPEEAGAAVLGVWSGALPKGPASRAILGALPPAARVQVVTDADAAGDRYAEAIMEAARDVGLDVERRAVTR